MLGELFRTQRELLTEAEVGALIAIDQIYEIQGSALDVDAQNTMARILEFCSAGNHKLAARCAKAVALLELLQSDEQGEPTDSKLVARCLYKLIQTGIRRWHLFVLEDNNDALAFWNKLGWSKRIELVTMSQSLPQASKE